MFIRPSMGSLMRIEHPSGTALACAVVASLLAALAGFVPPAAAQDSEALRALRTAPPTAPGTAPGSPAEHGVGGEWSGRYSCGQGITGVRVVLSPDASRGIFHFYAVPENPRVPEGCYRVSGSFDPGSRVLTLLAGSWIVRPRNYVTANATGLVDAGGQNFVGRITDLAGCTVIVLTHQVSSRPLPNACARGLP
jgi:hypothetical protein